MSIQAVKNRFGIIGSNEVLLRALEVALRVAPTDLSVLVSGESGVGKEFFPQIIHANSARKHNKFIAVNCGAIPEGTIDSELFGHEKGSFTGAMEARKGYFEEANGGTVFLDEVAELPLETQVRLLRVLQTGEYIRVGSSKSQKTDVRVVAATNKNLAQAVRDGKFREDLYYRLNTVPILVPALRERKEDIYLLFLRFATDIAEQYHMPAIELDDGARYLMESYPWPGNVRQLKNVTQQISAIEETREITEQIVRKYLPKIETSPMRIEGGQPRDTTTERDLLYRVLFDMRAEMSEIKQMLRDAMSASPGSQKETRHDVQAYLATSKTFPITLNTEQNDGAEEAVSEEVVGNGDESKKTKEQAERERVVAALQKHNGRRKEAAEELFISERTLYRKIKTLGIDEI